MSPPTDQQIDDLIQRMERTLRNTFGKARSAIDWPDVRSYAGEMIATYWAEPVALPTTCQAPLPARAGHLGHGVAMPLCGKALGRKGSTRYCSNVCRARAGRHGITAPPSTPVCRGAARHWPAVGWERLAQQELNQDCRNYISNRLISGRRRPGDLGLAVVEAEEAGVVDGYRDDYNYRPRRARQYVGDREPTAKELLDWARRTGALADYLKENPAWH